MYDINLREEFSSHCTVEPIVKLGMDGSWDAKMIDRRTHQLKAIAWKRLSSWLGL